MLGEALKDSSNAHDQGTEHDGQAPSILLVEPRGNGYSKNGTELVARRNESKKIGLDVVLLGVRGVPVSFAKV